MAQQKIQNNNTLFDATDIKTSLRILKKNWYIMIIFIVVSYLASYYYTYKLIDVYAASTQILLKSNENDVQSNVLQGLGYGQYRDYTDNYNAIRVVKSYDLIRKTLEKLNFEVSYFVKGRIRNTEVFGNLPFKVNNHNVSFDFYEKEFQIKFVDENTFNLTYTIDESVVSKKYPFNKNIIEADFSFTIQKAEGLDKETVKLLLDKNYIFTIHNSSTLINQYQASLNCEIPEYTGIIQISLEDILPERAIQFLDTLGEVYIDNTLQSKIDINKKTLDYIENQLQDLNLTITHIGDNLQQYKTQASVLNLEKEEEIFFTQLVGEQAKNEQFLMQMKSLKDLQRYITQELNTDKIPPTFLANSSDIYLNESFKELYTLQISKNNESYKNTKKGPTFADIDIRINLLKKNILNYISNSQSLLEEQIQKSSKTIVQYESKIGSIPIKQREIVSIQRQLEVNQKMYEYLLERKANTTITRAGLVPDAKIIERARSKGVVRPNKNKITYSFIGVGFALSLVIILLLTLFYEKVEYLDELRSKTHLTVMGEIIQSYDSKNTEASIFHANPKSTFVESFRNIRTNIQYLTDVEGPKTYLFTSRNPSEGKTFCSVNLAILFAKGGKRVLILEFDMHKPRVGSTLNLSSDIGLSTILIGKNKPEDCIVKTAQDGLEILLCGPTPPNASELILNKHMKTIFDFAKSNYDIIMIDTPPVGLISDAMVLMDYSDVNIFVLHTSFPYRESLNVAEEIVRVNPKVKLTMLLNGTKKNKVRYYLSKYGYKYGYGDDYGYGYGYGYGYSNSYDGYSK
jgi:tyrosine-protein kinase Etk/Wzc